MKKLTLLLAALLCLSLSACGNAGTDTPQDTSRNGDSFYAKVLSIEGDTVLAEALEGEWVLDANKQFTFSAAALPDIGISAGSYVNIVFTGEIPETTPAQINVVDWFDISSQIDYPKTAPKMTASFGESVSVILEPFPPIDWNTYVEGTNIVTGSIACGLHPLDDSVDPPTLEWDGSAPVLLLCETLLPDQITAIAWNADILTLPLEERLAASEDFITLETNGGYIFLPEDGQSYLVQATAVWTEKETERTPFGSANYLFLLE